MIQLYNTLTRKKEVFRSLHDKKVGLYTCGPTVYNFAHIGNLRTYLFEDILKRTLEASKYKVKHVMNITDVGHLTDDADAGEDKMEKGSKREGKSAWEIANFYTKAFQTDIKELNILPPDIWCKATDHLNEQIKMVQTLKDKGYTYETSDGIYFDTTRLDDYGKLAQLRKQTLKAGARVLMGEKKNPHDFALWKFSNPEDKRQMEWDAFGKKGFPGWHIECSAMSIKYLGEQFDIHCGGIDHIQVHHTNEIAQSEAATEKKPWVKYWLHGEFLNIADTKMAKSGENFITLQTLKNKDISPIAYRFFCLQTHYRKQLTFSWDALKAAQEGLDHLRSSIAKMEDKNIVAAKTKKEFIKAVNDDLNMPKAMAILWTAIKEKKIDKKTLFELDKIMGLELGEKNKIMSIPTAIQQLLDDRKHARLMKDWKKSDRLRAEILSAGYIVEDTKGGQSINMK